MAKIIEVKPKSIKDLPDYLLLRLRRAMWDEFERSERDFLSMTRDVIKTWNRKPSYPKNRMLLLSRNNNEK